MQNIFDINIKTKLTVLLVAVVVINTVIFSTYMYNSSRHFLLNSIDEQLRDATVTGFCILGSDYHDRVTDRTSISEDEYMFLMKKLSKLAKKLKVYYIYSFVERDGNILFSSTSATDKEFKSGNLDLFFDRYEEPSDDLKAIFRDPKAPIFENYNDNYGNFRSILVPFKNSRGEVYVVGADIQISFIDGELNKLIVNALLIGLVTLIVTMILSMVIVSSISKSMAQFQKGLFSFFDYLGRKSSNMENIELNSRDEFGAMATVINEHIDIIRKGIEKDQMLIKNANEVIQCIEQGKLNNELTADGYNPELQELKESINKMINTLKLRIGTDINKIIDTMNHYGVMNFDVKVDGELGDIAVNVNKMGEAIYKTLNELEKAKKDNREKTLFLEDVSQKLSKYLSPQLYDLIFEGKQDVKIETRRKKLTVFFSDIKGFTSTTEFLESEDLTAMLNFYLNEMSEIALKYGATIDKFIGDAIMIFFGDPFSDGAKEDAIKCTSMAIEMQKKMIDVREELFNRGIVKPFEIRVGIATGYVTVGNFGSDNRMDYTIIGGNVNLASRLESAAEENSILIAESTYLLIKDDIYCEKREDVTVKGFTNPIPTYEVIDHKDNIFNSTYSSKLPGFEINMDMNSIDDRVKLTNRIEEIIEEIKCNGNYLN